MSNNISKQLMFSMVTGDIYTIESDEYKNMDKYQLPLKKQPHHSCKKCYGRMHIGYDHKLKIYALCPKCTNNCVDFDLLKNDIIDIETIRNG